MNDFAKLKSAIGPIIPAGPPPEPPIDFERVVKKPKRGGLSIGLIASIQKEYQVERKEIEKQNDAKQTPPIGLKSGWGGKGR